jgi:hypothetical protein
MEQTRRKTDTPTVRSESTKFATKKLKKETLMATAETWTTAVRLVMAAREPYSSMVSASAKISKLLRKFAQLNV